METTKRWECNCVHVPSVIECHCPDRIATLDNKFDVAKYYTRVLDNTIVVQDDVCRREFCLNYKELSKD